MRSKSPRTALLAFLAALAPCAAFAGGEGSSADRVRWLAEHTLTVRSIAPADEDFSDLMPLLSWIGSARVVALGEVTHGDGSAFLAKGRLVRFLHQVMGFDVIAWESGFFDVPLVDTALCSDVPLQEAASRGLYKIWANSVEVQPALAYVRSTQGTAHPIRLAGFDCRVATERSRAELFPASIFEFFDRLDPHLISKQERTDLTAMSVGLVPADYYEHPGERRYNRDLPRRLVSVVDARRAELLAHYSPRQIDFVRQSLVSFMNMDRALGGQAGTGHGDNGYSRDKAMAENLLWLLDGPLSGHKVIVWAHNYHVLRDLPQAGASEEMAKNGSLAGPMGLHLSRALGRDLYVIGFAAHHGRYGYAGEKPETLAAVEPGSFEGLLHAAGKPWLLLNLHDLPPDHWLNGPLSSGFYFYEPQTTNMPRLYDAVFFLDEMAPSTAVGTP